MWCVVPKRGEFHWEGDLEGQLEGMDERIQKAMVASFNYVSTETLTFMRDNAPWTDRTSAARNGLGTKVVVTPKSCALVCYHSVPYGVFLEVRWNGKYGIIRDAMAYAAPRVVATLGALIKKR
jgi:hypothetical protein